MPIQTVSEAPVSFPVPQMQEGLDEPQVAQARYMSSSLYVDLTRAICIFIRICMGKITIVSVTYENVTI